MRDACNSDQKQYSYDPQSMELMSKKRKPRGKHNKLTLWSSGIATLKTRGIQKNYFMHYQQIYFLNIFFPHLDVRKNEGLNAISFEIDQKKDPLKVLTLDSSFRKMLTEARNKMNAKINSL